MTEEEKIEEMDKEIAELKKKKAELTEQGFAVIKAVPVPEDPREREYEGEYIPPDPTAEIIKEIPKLADFGKIKDPVIANPDNTGTLIPKSEFEGGIYIEWIDNRYHINGIHGIPNGNRIIVRSLEDIHVLIKGLTIAIAEFNQPKMINTKAPK